MGHKNLTRSFLTVLFSTNLVYSAVWAQSGDEVYRKLRGQTNVSKEASDQALHEAQGRARAQAFDQESDQYHKEVSEIRRKRAAMPKASPRPESDKDEDESPKAQASRGSGGAAPRGRPSSDRNEPPPSAPSSDVPKVAYDPLPDEIHFEGEPPSPAPGAKPGAARAVKPPPRALKKR